MKNIHRIKAIAFLFLFFYVMSANADLQSMVRETQKMGIEGNSLEMVWWIPNEYWLESFKDNPAMNDAAIEEFIDVFNDYTIVAVIDGKIGLFGGVETKKYEEIVDKLRLTIGKDVYKPIKKKELSQDLANFFDAMKPIMAGMLGQFGSGTEFFAFEGKGKKGVRLLEPLSETEFSITLNNTYHYRLPLGALLPNKIDPKTKEEFPGNYKFNPFTGTKLK